MKIKDYELVNELYDNDDFIIDGARGTKRVNAATMNNTFGRMTSDAFENINYGSTNLLNNTATSRDIFTVYSNKGVKITVSSAIGSTKELPINNELILEPNKTYILSCSTTTLRSSIVITNRNDDNTTDEIVTSKSVSFTTKPNYVSSSVKIRVQASSETYTEYSWPMVRMAIVTNDKYYPYAPSNSELENMMSNTSTSIPETPVLTWNLDGRKMSLRRSGNAGSYALSFVDKDEESDSSNKIFYTILNKTKMFLPGFLRKGNSEASQNKAVGSKSQPIYVGVDNIVKTCDVTDSYTSSGTALFNQQGANNLYKQMFYKPKDTITIPRVIWSGYITSSAGQIEFFIPLDKPVTATNAVISDGTFYIRHSKGGYVAASSSKNDGKITDFGTPTYKIMPTGILCTLFLKKSAGDSYNNCLVTVSTPGTGTPVKITFS